jgi:uncharacterized protein YdbL (DUF1318 family)
VKTAFLSLSALAVALWVVPAGAQQSSAIVQAKRAGLIGERFDGYLGFVANPPAALRRQVNAVNIRRRALYSGLASRKQATPEEVGITASCTLLATVGVGEYYLAAQGGWQRRGAGQPAPVPAYCR